MNLAWVTSVPGAALLLWPLTALYGPVAAYNAAIVACPALAAFGAYLLARELSGSFWPSLAGGWVFGFSSYLLGQSLGHLHVALVFPIPLLALQIAAPPARRDRRSAPRADVRACSARC